MTLAPGSDLRRFRINSVASSDLKVRIGVTVRVAVTVSLQG